MKITRTKEDDKQSGAEGWGLFETSAAQGGTDTLQLQRLDETKVFPNDLVAWRFVAGEASKGGELHLKALRYVRQESPHEYRWIAIKTGFSLPDEE
jgi:hypothetical protein